MYSMIKAVSFDVWFTIIYTNPIMDQQVNEIRKRGLIKLFEQYKVPIKSNEIISILNSAKKAIIKEKMEQGYIDFSNRDVQIPRVLNYMLSNIDSAHIKYDSKQNINMIDSFFTIITNAFVKLNPLLVPKIKQAIRYVRDQHLKMGIISNTGLTGGESLRKILIRYNLLQFFETTIFSDEAEALKPNPKIFDLISTKFNLNPSEIVHIGDTIDTDIAGARKSGFHEGILFLGVYDDRYQSRPLEEAFREYHPRYVIDDYTDFPSVLDAINKGKHTFRVIHNKKLRQRLNLN